MRKKIPYNLQFFAEPGEGQQDQNGNEENNDNGGKEASKDGNQSSGTKATIDFDKLLELVQGKQKVSEDSVLKGYFKQQGLSGEEMAQAISKFKEEKAAKTPNIDAVTKERDEALNRIQELTITNGATLEAVKLGIPEETVPYLLKLADFSNVMDDKGNVKEGSIKQAIEEVLKVLPQLKPTKEENTGFQIGGNGNGGEMQKTKNEAEKGDRKRWNRFR